jgi:hypothetical protein
VRPGAGGALRGLSSRTGAADPVERSTEWWHDIGASRSVFTDDRATLVVAQRDTAHIRIDLDGSCYVHYGIWYDTTPEYPAYLWVVGTIANGLWRQAFSGKHTLRVPTGSFRLTPDFAVPGIGIYTLEFTLHQSGAYWYSAADDIDCRHSGTVTIP